MATGFAAQVSAWADATLEEMRLVVVQSVLELEATAKELTPVKDGNLLNSYVVSLTGMPPMHKGDAPIVAGQDTAAALAGFELGGTIYLGITARYAARIEYGFTGVDSLGRYYDQKPAAYLRRATQNWQAIVDRNARRAQARAGFSQS